MYLHLTEQHGQENRDERARGTESIARTRARQHATRPEADLGDAATDLALLHDQYQLAARMQRFGASDTDILSVLHGAFRPVAVAASATRAGADEMNALFMHSRAGVPSYAASASVTGGTASAASAFAAAATPSRASQHRNASSAASCATPRDDDTDFMFVTTDPQHMEGVTWIGMPTRLFDATQALDTRKRAVAAVVRRATQLVGNKRSDADGAKPKRKRSKQSASAAVAPEAAAAAAATAARPKAPLMCQVCMDRPKACMIDCAHVSMCMECATQVRACPICRRDITKRERVHFLRHDEMHLRSMEDACIPACATCAKNDRNCVLSCGHATRCLGCASSMTNCTECRAYIHTRDCIVAS